MKLKMIKLLLLTIVICSCENENVEVKQTSTLINGREINNYIIDSCEYIGNIKGFNDDVLTHKGNCKFCIKRNKN